MDYVDVVSRVLVVFNAKNSIFYKFIQIIIKINTHYENGNRCIKKKRTSHWSL